MKITQIPQEVSGGVGGGVSEITASATWNFGSEEDSVVITVLSVVLTNANLKGFTVIPTETAETSLDDFKLNGVSFNIENIVDNVSFDIRASAAENASGVYTGTYKVIYA